jgi:hypothetical protein
MANHLLQSCHFFFGFSNRMFSENILIAIICRSNKYKTLLVSSFEKYLFSHNLKKSMQKSIVHWCMKVFMPLANACVNPALNTNNHYRGQFWTGAWWFPVRMNSLVRSAMFVKYARRLWVRRQS